MLRSIDRQLPVSENSLGFWRIREGDLVSAQFVLNPGALVFAVQGVRKFVEGVPYPRSGRPKFSGQGLLLPDWPFVGIG